jgi:hypothetical protein
MMDNVQKHYICINVGYCIENRNDYISLTVSEQIMGNHHDLINCIHILLFLNPLLLLFFASKYARISVYFSFFVWGRVKNALNCVFVESLPLG